MKIQEKVGKDTGSEIGSIPRSITAVLLEDLIDVCKPGDDVTVVGVVMRRWSTLGKGQEGRTGVWTLTHVSIGAVTAVFWTGEKLETQQQSFKHPSK